MKLSYRMLIGGFAIALFVIALNYSCKKMVTIDPPVTSTTGDAVFNDDATAIAVLTGIYSSISSPSLTSSIIGLNLITKRTGLSADELTLWSGAGSTDKAYYKNALLVNSLTSAGAEIWNTSYRLIASCNSAIEGLQSSKSLTPSVKEQLLGEARFIRAFIYFYLVNLYGDIPLVITSDYEINRLLSKTSKEEVYKFMISELKEAKTLLSSDYLNGQLKPYPSTTSERVRPTSWAATALLARVYLFDSDFANAELESTNLINNNKLFSLPPLSSVFLKNNSEAIWQLQPVNKSGSLYSNTEDGKFFNLTAAPVGLNSTHTTYLSPQLYSAFESNDNRKVNWVGTYTSGSNTYFFPSKYKAATGTSSISSITEYLNVFRLAEQFLIRSEARAQQNNILGSQNDLNVIRLRAGLASTAANDKNSLLSAILQERRVELFIEWGHRWLDLKRTGNVDVVMSAVTPLKANGSPWQSYQQWYPILLDDVQRDPNLAQNQGY